MTKTKFENRIRFNWGFHDATHAVEQGWATIEHNFGFYKHGPLAGLQCASEVLRRHFDRVYAEGWSAGWSAMQPEGAARPESSETAWREALAEGRVSEW